MNSWMALGLEIAWVQAHFYAEDWRSNKDNGWLHIIIITAAVAAATVAAVATAAAIGCHELRMNEDIVSILQLGPQTYHNGGAIVLSTCSVIDRVLFRIARIIFNKNPLI